jgi:hypothetical protein
VVRSKVLGPSGAITDYGVRRVIMPPDAILAAWRAWLVWCQISQTRSVLLMYDDHL